MRASRKPRFVKRPPDLTSLFDVLFIVVFVALIRAAAAEQSLAKASEPPPPKPAPPPPVPVSVEVQTLRTTAVANLHKDIDARAPIVIRIGAKPYNDPDAVAAARIDMIEVGGKRIEIALPLLERDPTSNVSYLPSRSGELRLCKLAATRAELDDLSKHFVIVAPTLPRRVLPTSLIDGLEADVAHCTDLKAIASIVYPPPAPPTP